MYELSSGVNFLREWKCFQDREEFSEGESVGGELTVNPTSALRSDNKYYIVRFLVK